MGPNIMRTPMFRPRVELPPEQPGSVAPVAAIRHRQPISDKAYVCGACVCGTDRVAV
ncbi:hypothetical protein [Microvirga soli]|uniref:hypothetical protein n=1 Tax=Microvirga soli TaxID=1854496 RepID=UPI00191E2FE0|nr:hypothetical protein [Microvirga soli]